MTRAAPDIHPAPAAPPHAAVRAEDLVAAMDPDLLVELCGCPVDDALRSGIVASPRMRARLAGRARAALGLPASAALPEGPAAARLAHGTAAEVDELLLLAGGLAASGPIRRTVGRGGVARLRGMLGPRLYALVLSEGGAPEDGGTLPADRGALRASGIACLADWLAGADPAAAAILSVRLTAAEAGVLGPDRATPGGGLHLDVAAEMLDAHAPEAAHA